LVNHLQDETSPYLQQHASNPVDWYPWGEEAFALARARNAPIFLSIGYATCHFCHVMREESFSDSMIAAGMNELFVNIKVDREDLPEIDRLYMELAQGLMSTQGGWPLNMVLTPDLKPFFATTYLPPRTDRGLIGMQQFITQIGELWNSPERELLIQQADHLVEIFSEMSQERGDELPEPSLIEESVELLFELADPVSGGLKTEPKFPLAYHLNFLLEFASLKGDPRALFYVELTLKMMQRGGIYDQIGGGFSRYSVDSGWKIPHFEKMLYDNALMASAYLAAWHWTRNALYRRIVEESLNYLLREMRHEEGGFYSAEDADSEGKEGFFYTWTPQEIHAQLPASDADLFCQFYDVTLEGNFEGRSILHKKMDVDQFADENGIEVEELEEILERSKELLLTSRNRRVHPFKDEKLLTSWNALMIDTLILSAVTLKEESYKKEALSALAFIKTHLWKEGRLMHRYCLEETKFEANLDDYAFLIRALLTLFECDCGAEHLVWAVELAQILEMRFKAPRGAFYASLEEESLFCRRTSFYDGAEPCGNAVHAENLLRLYQLTTNRHYLYQAEEIFKAAELTMQEMPMTTLYLMRALQRYYNKKAPLLVVVLDESESLKKEIEELLYFQFSPHRALIWMREKNSLLMQQLPFLKDKRLCDGQTTLYVCYGDHCAAPLVGREQIREQLQNLG